MRICVGIDSNAVQAVFKLGKQTFHSKKVLAEIDGITPLVKRDGQSRAKWAIVTVITGRFKLAFESEKM